MQHVETLFLRFLQGLEDVTAYLHGVGVVLSEVVGDAADGGMHLGTTQLLGSDYFTYCRFDERRTSKIMVP